MDPDERHEPVYGCLWWMRRIDAYWEGASTKTVGEKNWDNWDKGWRFPQKRHHDGMHPIAIPTMKHERKILHQMNLTDVVKQGTVICNINHLPAEDGVYESS